MTIKFKAAFRDEWARRYEQLEVAGKRIKHAVRNDSGCMCAIGVAYDLLVEQGVGEWRRDVHDGAPQFKIQHAYCFGDIESQGAGGFSTVFDVDASLMSRIISIINYNDADEFDKTLNLIRQLPVQE